MDLLYLCTRKQETNLASDLNGVLVQLVRIHACHAWGHGFESRTHRITLQSLTTLERFCFFPSLAERGLWRSSGWLRSRWFKR